MAELMITMKSVKGERERRRERERLGLNNAQGVFSED